MEFLEVKEKREMSKETKHRFHILDDYMFGLRHHNTVLKPGNWVVRLDSGRTFVVNDKVTLDELLDEKDLKKRVSKLERDLSQIWVWDGTRSEDYIR